MSPRQGLTVAFPGWLVHAVTPSNEAAQSTEQEADDADVGGWRVSFSFNLHGEWRDTSAVLLEFN